MSAAVGLAQPAVSTGNIIKQDTSACDCPLCLINTINLTSSGEAAENGLEDDSDACSVCSDDSTDTALSAIDTDQTPDSNSFRFENGRRYHAYRDESWLFPNDEPEQDRMQIVDQMLSLLFDGGLYTAPVPDPRRILDVGTGTGVWAIEMADRFPNARVFGTDLSPIQVPGPANCRFEIEDADSEWLWPPNYFSLIHTRQLMGGISNWHAFFERSFHRLHPGGYLELHETPATVFSTLPELSVNSSIKSAIGLYINAFASLARPVSDEVYDFSAMMRQVGFIDVELTKYRLPIGAWGDTQTEKEVGRWNSLNFMEGIEGALLACCTRQLGMTVEQIHEIVAACRKEAKDKNKRLYYYLVVIKGRKPQA